MKPGIRTVHIFIVFGILIFQSCRQPSRPVRFGVIADCQYCDCPAAGSRFYKESPGKLSAAFDSLDTYNLDFILHLGDFIDRNLVSFKILNSIGGKSNTEIYHVLGNHDFSVKDDEKSTVPGILNMPSRYYSFTRGDWRFLILDGNDMSFQGYPSDQTPPEALKMFADVEASSKSNAHRWNGGIGKKHLKWLEQQLSEADSENQKVILLCHFPIYPSNAHNLWNDEALLEVIKRHGCVKAWFNGHNHAGNYGIYDDIHFVTFPGMVETADSSAYAVVTLDAGAMNIEGKGKTLSRVLAVR